jgi:hypothetical protein
MLGDTIYYTDDELFDVVRRVCKNKYDGQRPTLLGKNEKVEMARMLHYDYNADNEQIRRMLNLSLSYLNQLFPPR